MSSSNLCSLSYSGSAAMLCPRSVCLLVRMCNFFLSGVLQNPSKQQNTISVTRAIPAVGEESCLCCDFMSVGEMLRSAHQISAEKYRKNILEGSLRLAASASCSAFNFPTTHSFSIESCVGFALGFVWLGIASFLLNSVNTA